jgi:hypothetical protein
MEAVFIPWFAGDGKTICAVQHRFIVPSLERGERYTLKPGSKPVLFGLHALAPAQTLAIVEGEFNCMSLHQIGTPALSFGSESNIGHPKALAELGEHLPNYEQVVVWFDRPESGQQVVSWLGDEGLFRKGKIQIISHGLDANELLGQGQLAAFWTAHHITPG